MLVKSNLLNTLKWLKLTDTIHSIFMAVQIHKLSFMIDPTANHHSDAGFIRRVTSGPGKWPVWKGWGPIFVLPLINAEVVSRHTDGEPLVLWVLKIQNPVLDTGPLLLGFNTVNQPPNNLELRFQLSAVNLFYFHYYLTRTPFGGRTSLCSEASRGTCGPPSLRSNIYIQWGLGSYTRRSN